MPTMIASIPNEVLNNNVKIPILGLGSFKCTDEPGSTVQIVKDAIDMGYRHFDLDQATEKEVGEAIAAKVKEGVVKREELYLVSKLNDTKAFHNPEMIKQSLLKTLSNMSLAYIDMYVIHCPEGSVFADEAFVDT